MPEVSLPYPIKGLHLGTSYSNQPDGTTPDALNERSYDAIEERARGGQRNGTSKFHGSQINSTNAVQTMDRAVALDTTATVASVSSAKGSIASLDLITMSGSVAHPTELGVFFHHKNQALTSPNVYRFDDDLTETWGVDITGITGAGSSVGNSDLKTLAISSDGLYLFLVGAKQASGTYVDKNLWVLNTSDGSVVVSGLTENVSISANDNWSISAITKTDGTYRLCIICEGLSIFIMDFDASDSSLTQVWEFQDGGSTSFSLAQIHPTNEDVFYLEDDSSATIKRFNISTQSLAWSYDHSGDLVGNSGLASTMDVDTNGNIYIGGTDGGSPNRNLIKVNDNTTSGAFEWYFDANLGNTVVTGVKLRNNDELFATGSSYNQNVIIDVSGTAAATLFGTSSLQFQDRDGNTGYAISSIAWHPDTNQRIIQLGLSPAALKVDDIIRINPANVGEVTRKSALMAISGGSIWQIVNPPVGQAELTQMGSRTVSTTLFRPQSTEYSGVFYICDGTSTGYTTATPDYSLPGPSPTSAAWTPTDGSLPTNGSFGAKLIELYRGRIVLSGIQDSEQNIWFSKVGDPLDWNASPTVSSALQPVVLNTGTAGVIGDIVNTMIPHNDDLMLIGGDHTINVLRGDPSPRSGGRIDLVSDITGMWFGRCWAMAPSQTLYFMGTDGVYRMRILGDQITSPESITGFRLDEVFQKISTNQVRIQLVYSLRHKGVYVFVTNIAAVESFAYFYCERTDSWHKDQYPINHGPTCVLAYDGDDPKDRTILLGGRSGFIRRLDSRADDDDGTAISSHVVYPPYKLDGKGFNMRAANLRRIGATLGKNTDSLTYEVRVADDAESVLDATSEFSGTWTGGGKKDDVRSRASGGVVSLKLSNTSDDSEWAVEEITATIDPGGPVR